MENRGDDEDEFWASGITEDLIVKVAGAGLIRVAPMKEILEVDIKKSFEEIAKKLRVKYLLTSSLHKKEDGFDLRCQLIDAESGNSQYANKWSESIDKAPTIVGNLADNILKSLRVSTKQEITRVSTSSTEAYEYYLKAIYYSRIREDNEDTELVKGLLEKAIELDDNLIKAKIVLADLYENLGHYKKSIELYKLNLIQAEKLNLKREIAFCLISIAFFQSNFLEDSLRLSYFKRALNIYEKLNNKNGISQALESIGMYYCWTESDEQNDKLCLEYMNRSFKILEELDDKLGLAMGLNNIGIVYGHMGDEEKELDTFFKALTIYKELDNKSGISLMLWNIGFTYVYTFYNYELGIDYIKQSVDIGDKLGQYDIAHSGKMSHVYWLLGDYEMALKLANEGIQYFKEQEWYVEVADMHGLIALINNEKGLYKKSIIHSEQAILLLNENKFPYIPDELLLNLNVILSISKKNLGQEYDIVSIHNLIKIQKEIKFEQNLRLFELIEDKSYLKTAYNQVQEKADNLEPEVAAKFLSYPIPKAIVEEWEKVTAHKN